MARPFIPAPNTASVEMIYSWGGVTCENVFHVRKGSSYSLADLQAVRGIVLAWYIATLRTYVTAGAVLVRIRTKALDTDTGPMEDYAVTASGGGLNSTGSNAPTNATYCIKLSTGLSGRSARGRWYFIGLNMGDVVTSVDISAALRINLVNAINTLRTNLTTGGHTMCVTSYRHDGAWRATAVNYDITTAVGVDLHIDSQRRRLAGRGI